MKEYIILVDEQDNETGYGEKMEVHEKGLLHRAFSIFIFDWLSGKMLLQRRASGKYHSGGLWTNACCSHPRRDETMEGCLNNRLKDELGLDTSVHIVNPKDREFLLDGMDVIYSCGSFKYYAPFGDLSEHEIDHVFLYSPSAGGFSMSDFICNPDEVDEIKWVTIAELEEWMSKTPEDFTAWFKNAYELAYEVISRQASSVGLDRRH